LTLEVCLEREGEAMCMQSPEVKARFESDTEPRVEATGERCFDIQMYDEKGKWIGAGGTFPLTWIRATDEAPWWFKKNWSGMEKKS
jgi:hypothetical protein